MLKSKSRVFIGLFIITLIFTQHGFSQQNVLSLKECIDIALENNSSLRNAARRVDIAKANVVTAKSGFLPRVNSSFGSGKYVQGPRQTKTDVPVDFDPLTGQVFYEERTIRQKSTDRNYNSASVSLSQNIWDFGRSTNYLKMAKANREATEQTKLSTQQTVVLNVKAAYFNLLKAEKLYQVYEEAAKLAEEQENRAQTMMDIGIASKAEVFQARVNKGSNKRQAITQQNIVEMAKAGLNTALGIDPNTAIEIEEIAQVPTFLEYEFDEAVNRAFENNPYIKSLDLSVKASLYNLRSAKARYMPTIGASVSYSRSNDELSRVYSTKFDEDYTASVGAQVDLNVFNGFSDKAEIQRQTLNYEISLEDLAEQKRLIVSDVKQYFLELKAYEDILEIQKENIEAAKENLRLQQEKRRVGSGTELDVTDAQVELTRAQSDYVSAEHDAHTAKARLQAAMGVIE